MSLKMEKHNRGFQENPLRFSICKDIIILPIYQISVPISFFLSYFFVNIWLLQIKYLSLPRIQKIRVFPELIPFSLSYPLRIPLLSSFFSTFLYNPI